MEVRHRIFVINNNPQYNILKQAFDDLGIKYEYKPNGFLSFIICYISDSDPNYEKLKPQIYHEHVQVKTGMFYSPKDFEESEWFYVNTSESQYPEGEKDYHYDTYDLTTWCNKCGQGAVQNRPFRLPRDFQQKRDKFFGLHWVFDEIFCRPEIKPILDENGLSGLSYLHPIYHKSGKTIDTTYQMKIDFVTAPGIFNDGLEIQDFSVDRKLWTTQDKYARHCPFCNRVKFLYPERNVIRFTRKTLKNIPDVVKSYEYFGADGQAQRLILVSKKFYDVIRKNKLSGLVFTPIRLV